MKNLLVVGLFVNAALLAGRFWQELSVVAEADRGGTVAPCGTDPTKYSLDTNADGGVHPTRPSFDTNPENKNRLIFTEPEDGSPDA
jgi:hypothetical protein